MHISPSSSFTSSRITNTITLPLEGVKLPPWVVYFKSQYQILRMAPRKNIVSAQNRPSNFELKLAYKQGGPLTPDRLAKSYIIVIISYPEFKLVIFSAVYRPASGVSQACEQRHLKRNEKLGRGTGVDNAIRE
ncbi:hypothetical protein BDDG_11575 [Blastomyces dermatitidis ATCC 18188]|uniref:Uncharacterized protein n=1 Tax=Ajellomyces dermatitidis (strain ATCC 18188 / CBS 674.68) TaxID=653446 RepID=A0A0J9HBZ8_AJEDA|nr:hypothetical protein BDDG_11575 [Blastomyces dermatitidis ATCC 18188]